MPRGWASRGHACSPQLSTCGPSPLPEACMEQTPHSFQKLNMELNIQRVYHVEKPIIYVISADPKPTRVSSDMTHNSDKACRMGLRLVPRCCEGAGVLSHHAGHLQVPLPGVLTRGGPCTPHARTGAGTTETAGRTGGGRPPRDSARGPRKGSDPVGVGPGAAGPSRHLGRRNATRPGRRQPQRVCTATAGPGRATRAPPPECKRGAAGRAL